MNCAFRARITVDLLSLLGHFGLQLLDAHKKANLEISTSSCIHSC